MDGSPIISFREVGMRIDGRVILSDVDFDIRRGDFMAVTGPNGGGKTTLLRIMLRLLKPTSGRVVYIRDGEECKYLKFGYLPQKSKIDTRFPITVGEAVKSGQLTGFFRRRTKEDEERFAEVAALTEIEDILDRSVGVLSGGQLQRTLLARAIISRPEVIVLDEPLSYVDKEFEQRIYSIVERLAREATIVLVSHEMSVISEMANRHLTVDRGIRSLD